MTLGKTTATAVRMSRVQVEVGTDVYILPTSHRPITFGRGDVGGKSQKAQLAKSVGRQKPSAELPSRPTRPTARPDKTRWRRAALMTDRPPVG